MDHTLISQAIAGGIALWMNYVIRSSLIAEDVPPTSWVPPHQPTLALSVEYLRYMSKVCCLSCRAFIYLNGSCSIFNIWYRLQLRDIPTWSHTILGNKVQTYSKIVLNHEL